MVADLNNAYQGDRQTAHRRHQNGSDDQLSAHLHHDLGDDRRVADRHHGKPVPDNTPAGSDSSSVISAEILAGDGLYLVAAAKLFPRHRQGRPVSPSTVSRWATNGVRLADGQVVRLEALQLAGKWITTRGAIRRFLDRQTPARADQPGSVRSPAKRDRDQRRTNEALRDRYGIF
jgi:hypothetical protein